MRQALKLHPDSRCDAVKRIDVEVARPRAGAFVLHYVMVGKIDDVRLAPVAASRRADELWRHTCLEAFVQAAPLAAYVELNFATSMEWAAYRFDRYREGMAAADEIGAPVIDVHATPESFALDAVIDLSAITNLPRDAIWRLGLSAVIEETNGRKSYWALAHPPGKPDFHHSDCFTLEVAAPSRA